MAQFRLFPTLALVFSLLLGCTGKSTSKKKPDYALVIHGGAGTILKKNMSEEEEKAYRDALEAALQTGEEVLASGGSSVDAVVAVITLMEDSPLFNAGKGAVFTHEGKNELDASLMNGKDLNVGAIAGVTRIKNPIQLARKVMENSEHVFFARDGAEAFALEQGMELMDPSYFYTDRRWQGLQRALEKEKSQKSATTEPQIPDSKFGTVGCVALDKNGNLAAGTSTGGMTNKRFGRIGDSPIIGAGTYANNNSCAVSATGHGEFFIRNMVAYDIAAMMSYQSMPVAQAAEAAIEKVGKMNATGGVIVLDGNGNIAMPFNTEGMYRGYIIAGEKPVIKIYKE
ncbi:MAG: isoaspartyl peptidase/L-asparaginase [Deferribacteres bacterium]|nr:isoaspartyl peptidase/L-asparaginase [candidate division KSB1 bacterium]MCB9501177.1 isoaspartyl peptidase/L-asparaginase [Deferribacteres bacterium]